MEFTQTTKPTKKTKPVKQQSTVVEEQPALVKEEPTVVEEQPPAPTEVRLVDIPIENENVALNVMVGFLNVAHKRGAFTIDESAKIWECISTFQKK
jgi:hypothetical protein